MAHRLSRVERNIVLIADLPAMTERDALAILHQNEYVSAQADHRVWLGSGVLIDSQRLLVAAPPSETPAAVDPVSKMSPARVFPRWQAIDQADSASVSSNVEKTV